MIKHIKESSEDSATKAANHLKNGGIVAFATDTIYGFGVDASSESAVSTLYELKKRDQKKAIAVLFKDLSRAKKLLDFSDFALVIAKKFLPGPLTVILPVKKRPNGLANNLNVNDDFIGCRIVDTKFINELFAKFDGNIALSSANLSFKKVAQSGEEIYKNFSKTNLDLLVVDSGELEKNMASTVVKIHGNELEILREGAISKKDISNF